VDSKTRDNFTALHIAVLMSYKKVMRLLLNRGANVETQIQWPGVEDDYHEDWEWSETDEDDWLSEDSDDGDNDYCGPFQIPSRPPPLLSNCLRRLLFDLEIVPDVKDGVRSGLTVHQLAASSENVTVQRLLEQYCHRQQ